MQQWEYMIKISPWDYNNIYKTISTVLVYDEYDINMSYREGWRLATITDIPEYRPNKKGELTRYGKHFFWYRKALADSDDGVQYSGYEYVVETVPFDDDHFSDGLKQVEKTLQDLGKEGYELVAVTTAPVNTTKNKVKITTEHFLLWLRRPSNEKYLIPPWIATLPK